MTPNYENLKFYVLIYKFFKEKSHKNCISYPCIREILNRRLHKLPKRLRYEFLKEMEHHKLVKKFGSINGIKFYELTGGNVDNLLKQYYII